MKRTLTILGFVCLIVLANVVLIGPDSLPHFYKWETLWEAIEYTLGKDPSEPELPQA